MMNILVVDDDTVQLESLRRGLRNKGHQVVEAVSGEEALERFTHSNMAKIDLVLSDFLKFGEPLAKEVLSSHKKKPYAIQASLRERVGSYSALARGR